MQYRESENHWESAPPPYSGMNSSGTNQLEEL